MLSNHRKQSLRAITYWVLVLVLLLGQSLALAHDHDADRDSEGTCALCLYAQQSDNVIPSTAAGISAQKYHVFTVHPVSQESVAVTVSPFNSRAPPFISR